MRQGSRAYFVTSKFQPEINRLRDLALQLSPYLFVSFGYEIPSHVQVGVRGRSGNPDLAPGWLARINSDRDRHVCKNLLLPEAVSAPVVS